MLYGASLTEWAPFYETGKSMYCPNKITQLQIMNIGVTPMEAIQYLGTLFVAVFALFLSGCARQIASADRAQRNPIAIQVATPKHVRVAAEVVVSGTVETPSAPISVGFLVSGKVIRVGPARVIS
jgi:hypothetical protein